MASTSFPLLNMDEVHHVHHTDADSAGMSAVMMVVLLIALVGLALFTFFALNGLPRSAPADDIDVGIEGQINLPEDSTPDGQ